MTVYSVVFWDADVTADGTSTDLWTVPAGFVDVIRDIDGYSGYSGTQQAWIGTDGHYWRTWPTLAGYDSLEWRGRQVVEAGQVVSWLQTHHPCSLRISGYRLSGP